MDKHALSDGMVQLASAYRRKIGDEDWRTTLRIYYSVLRRLTDEEWRAVVAAALEADETAFPRPGRLLGYARAGHRGKAIVPKCEMCGLYPVSVRALCADCALECPDRSAIRVQPRHDQAAEVTPALVDWIRSCSREPGEKPSEYIHRIALSNGLLRGPGLFEREPGEEG